MSAVLQMEVLQSLPKAAEPATKTFTLMTDPAGIFWLSVACPNQNGCPGGGANVSRCSRKTWSDSVPRHKGQHSHCSSRRLILLSFLHSLYFCLDIRQKPLCDAFSACFTEMTIINKVLVMVVKDISQIHKGRIEFPSCCCC